MRSLSVFRSFALRSFIGLASCRALAQAMTKRDALVEHKAFAAPAALGFGHALKILQDAALEVIDLGKAARQQIGAGLLATDAAGAEHGDPAMFLGIEVARRKLLELAKAPDAGIDGAFERAHRDLEGVAGVEHQRIRRSDQVVPVGR